MKQTLTALLCALCCYLAAPAQTTDSDAVFKQFFDNAVAYADAYPREKAYLHFDNSSYYVGDTIWFKAYTTLTENHAPSLISKPLYVEMLDQAGNVSQRQIIEMNNGEGHGQLVLDASTLSGYYEIRAYTRWMQAFDEPVYFSRTFPIYQAANGETLGRNISTYRLNPSMKQRPKTAAADKPLVMQFFPEGGSLVAGVPSCVAFKAESRDEDNVVLKGVVCTKEGEVLAELETLHNGMGTFNYTPGEKPAMAKVTYKDKEYKFNLPAALPAGYVLSVTNSGGAIVGSVTCNAATPDADIVAFISREGRPYNYWTLNMKAGSEQNFLFRTRGIPGGIYQISLLDKSGRMLCERFTFVQPAQPITMQVEGIKEVYHPFETVRCEVQITDKDNNPVQGTFSVSVRDAMRSDYAAYDNTMFTDMLLTSGLRGYIHQPGYYFSNITTRKLQALDALLMVHGWRQYDMSQLVTGKPTELKQQPEKDLLLCGQIRSTFLKKELKDMEVSIMTKVDDDLVAGQTFTDEEGRFQLPVNGFEGEVEALFQTRRKGAKRKKDAIVSLDRNFAPALRALDYAEEHPQWIDKKDNIALIERIDSLYRDSISKLQYNYMLDEVSITAKRKTTNITTQVFEKSVEAYYDVPRLIDELRDKGKTILTVPDFLRLANPNFNYNLQNSTSTYKEKTICVIVGKQILSPSAAQTLWNQIDGIKKIMICEGSNSYTDEIMTTTLGTSVEEDPSLDVGRTFDSSFYETGSSSSEIIYNINNGIDVTRLGQYALFYITPQYSRYNKNEDKNMRASLGTRRTLIQGYTKPLAFYSPAYTDKEPDDLTYDHRRTLYWNPSVQTDENGKAVIECHNAMYSNPVVVQAEMLKDGVPCSVKTWKEEEEE